MKPTNHERMLERKVWLDQRKKLLKELIVKTKANHPNEKKPYREWVKLAVAETKETLIG